LMSEESGEGSMLACVWAKSSSEERSAAAMRRDRLAAAGREVAFRGMAEVSFILAIGIWIVSDAGVWVDFWGGGSSWRAGVGGVNKRSKHVAPNCGASHVAQAVN
jgi:hypothetical protein